MSLRESPAIRTARLPDGREIAVRVMVSDDPYVPQSEGDTVVAQLEAVEGGTVLAVVATPLSATTSSAPEPWRAASATAWRAQPSPRLTRGSGRWPRPSRCDR